MNQIKIHKVIHDKNYIIVNLTACNCHNLSWGAKGLHLYLMSRPPNWELNYSDLLNRATEQRTALNTLVTELKESGFLKIISKRDEKGRFDYYLWEVYEVPFDTKIVENQHPKSDFPKSDSQQGSKDYINNKQSYTASSKNEAITSSKEPSPSDDLLEDSYINEKQYKQSVRAKAQANAKDLRQINLEELVSPDLLTARKFPESKCWVCGWKLEDCLRAGSGGDPCRHCALARAKVKRPENHYHGESYITVK